MPEKAIIKQGNREIYPVTKYEYIIDAPDVYNADIYVGTEAPQDNRRLWVDTSGDAENQNHDSDVIESIQNAIYLLQQKVSKLMLMRTQGIIPGKVTDSTLTEIGNANEPVVPDIVADEEHPDVEYPEYASESEPTVNHFAVKMGTWTEITAARKFFINGEMVWCTNRNTMYIYVNGNFKALASGSGNIDDNDDEFNDDTMDTTQLQQYLDNLDSISFIPVNNEDKKYTVKVNEYGNLVVYDSNNDSVLTRPSSRGLYFPGYDGGDGAIGRIMINSVYIGGLDNNEHSYQSCSHNFVELANIGYSDINLNGLCLMYTSDDINWDKLPLWGVIKAQSTFLIRGAQCSVMDVNTTKIKVKTFDMEWYKEEVNGTRSLIKFDRNPQNFKAAFYLCWCDLEDNNRIYIMDGDDNIKAEVPSTLLSIIDRDNGKTAYGYVDLAGFGKSGFYENKTYSLPSGKTIDENTFFVKKYVLDPVTQSNGKGIAKRNNVKFWQYIDLSEYLSDHVERYTPKASFENKNLSTDKHNFVEDQPNTITCSFGIQATDNTASGGRGATRCFNWNSVGYYDEYVWYKKKTDSVWNKVESYKEGVDYTTATGLNRATDPDSILIGGLSEYYKRIRWETFYGAPMTTHKLMIAGLTSGVYEYKIGRADENGDPTDYISKTREFTVKADSEVTSFDFIQTTDQQGANWEEYQVWDLSAEFISNNERIGQTPKVSDDATSPGVNQNDFDFTINTGDITYNGSRPNEWIDYYNGYSYLDDKEEMFTIGNNDLAPIPEDLTVSTNPKVYGMTILGYGRERPDKISHFVADLFYTQEMDHKNPPIFRGEYLNSVAEKNFRIPSLYSFNYGQFHFVSLNSEIRTGYPDDVPTTVTGEFGVKDNYSGNKSQTYQKVEDWLVRDLLIWKNGGQLPVSYDPEHPENHRFDPQNCQKAIIYCHEMPFTITAAGTYAKYLKPDATGSVFRESSKANLNTKHAFQFQRLFKIWGIRLIFGGHKHTCSLSMPIYDAPANYVPWESTNSDLMADLTGADTFNPIIQVVRGDTDPNWGVDGKIGHALENFDYRGKIMNSTNSNVTVNLSNGTQTFAARSITNSDVAKPLCRYEIVDAISAPTYVMCQATGYKNMSNSDTSDGTEHCQWQRALVQGQEIDYTMWEGKDLKEDQRADQLYPFYTRFHVTNNSIQVNLQRVANMYKPNSKAGYWDVNRDMANGHEATQNKLYRLPWVSCEISLL